VGGGDLDAAVIAPKLAELSTALEERTTQSYQAAALEEVQTEHAQYFEALKQHPRLLVGTQVPAIGKEGMETLRDTNDAREWQEAVKTILVQEINDRAGRQMEESSDFLTTVHASIELFTKNPDLIPNTKGFDRDLADRFATLAKPYELRVDGKLQGYSIPVQPIIDNLRTTLAARRTTATKTAPPASSTSSAGGAPAQPAQTVDPPQAGIASKAGNSGEKEDFSTLFGTIGLPNLQI
jgi:hypothetical protein